MTDFTDKICKLHDKEKVPWYELQARATYWLCRKIMSEKVLQFVIDNMRPKSEI